MPNIFVSPEPPASSSTHPASYSKKRKKWKKIGILKYLFSPYFFMPDGIKFQTQEPGETIILLLRKHWITNFSWILTGFIFLIIPVIFFPIIIFENTIIEQMSTSFISFLILVWYLILFSYTLVNFLLWYFTVSIVTSERIIDIDYINILNKKFAATRISKIEDVTMRARGFINTIFDFGDVITQTAATEAQFEFIAVPQPEKVVRTINKLMGKEEE